MQTNIVQFPTRHAVYQIEPWMKPDAWQRALAREGGNAERARFWLDLAKSVWHEANRPGRKDTMPARQRLAIQNARKTAQDAGASERDVWLAMATAAVEARDCV
jgi:hypothetical protein